MQARPQLCVCPYRWLARLIARLWLGTVFLTLKESSWRHRNGQASKWASSPQLDIRAPLYPSHEKEELHTVLLSEQLLLKCSSSLFCPQKGIKVSLLHSWQLHFNSDSGRS